MKKIFRTLADWSFVPSLNLFDWVTMVLIIKFALPVTLWALLLVPVSIWLSCHFQHKLGWRVFKC